MGFGEAIKTCFQKYFTFGGRSIRSEYWFWTLFTVLASIVLSLIDYAVFGVDEAGQPKQVLGVLFSLATFFPTLAVTFRRLHDTDRSGWWFGAPIIVMILGGIALGVAIAGGGHEALGSMVLLLIVAGVLLLIWSIAILVFLCLRGTPGPNRYGENPLMLGAPPVTPQL